MQQVRNQDTENKQTDAAVIFAQAQQYINTHIENVIRSSTVADLNIGYALFDGWRIKIIAAHPDCCGICNEAIVPKEEQMCTCEYRACLACVGRSPRPKCAGCNTPFAADKLEQLISKGRLLLGITMMCTKDFTRFRPEIDKLRQHHRDLLQQEQQSEDAEIAHTLADEDMVEPSPEVVAAQEQELARVQRDRRQQHRERNATDEEKDDEQKDDERETRRQERLARRSHRNDDVDMDVGNLYDDPETSEEKRDKKEQKMADETHGLLEFCHSVNDQRSFSELTKAINEQLSWSQQRIDTKSAASMDITTIQAQWFITANLEKGGFELRFLSRLRLGELFDGLDHLAKEKQLETKDRNGNAIHHSTALEYLHTELKYDKKHDTHIRSCHQFFLVWKEWHPIIAVSKTQMSWSWLQEALTRSKLLEAVRKFKEEARPAVAPASGESLAVPEQFRNTAAPAIFHRVIVQPSRRSTPMMSLKVDGVEIQPVLCDSFYLPGFIQKIGFDPANIQRVLEGVGFVSRENDEMRYRGSTLARDKNFFVRSPVNEQGEPMVLAKYTYPGFQYGSMKNYRAFSAAPELERLIDTLQQKLQVSGSVTHFNHAIGTRYSKDKDNIGYHMDKMDDITPGTPIVSLSFGDAREFHFCKTGGEKGEPEFVQVLNAGDVFILGPRTNATLKHAVPLIKDEKKIKRGDAGFSDRISVVLRNIRTNISREDMLERAAH